MYGRNGGRCNKNGIVPCKGPLATRAGMVVAGRAGLLALEEDAGAGTATIFEDEG
jgi:hypothetical protein